MSACVWRVWVLTVVTAVYSINHLALGTAVCCGSRLSFASRGEWSKLIEHYPAADPGNESDTTGLDLPA